MAFVRNTSTPVELEHCVGVHDVVGGDDDELLTVCELATAVKLTSSCTSRRDWT
jgi:hypothetical protein